MLHFAHGDAPVEDCAGWAGHDAFPATGAAFRLAPRLAKISDDQGFHASSRDALGVGTLDFPADAHTTGAKDATVVVNAKQRVGDVHAPLRELVIKTHMVHALVIGQG